MAYSFGFRALDGGTTNSLDGVTITHNQKICDGQHAQANPDIRCDTNELVSSTTGPHGMTTIGLGLTAQVRHYFYAQYPGRPSKVVLADGGRPTEFSI